VGDIRDRAFLEQAFGGAHAALLVVRADRGSRDFRREFAEIGFGYGEAVRAAGVPNALFLSSTGAHHERHRGLVLVHRDVELMLGQVPSLSLTSLRAPFFLENIFYFISEMKARNAAAMPLDPDVAFDAASTAEIAGVALQLLLEPRAGSVVHEIRRKEPITLRAIAAVLERELARSFPCQRTTRSANVAAMVAAGASYDFAHLMNDAWDTFSHYGLLRDESAEASHVSTPVDAFLRAAVIPAIAQKPG